VDCCKGELPFVLPSEVVSVQQHEASEPQSSNDVDTVSGEAEQMSSTDQTTDNVADTTNTNTTIEDTSTAVASLDPAPPTVSVQEDVAEPMELDHQISIPTIGIIPTGMGSVYIMTTSLTLLVLFYTFLRTYYFFNI